LSAFVYDTYYDTYMVHIWRHLKFGMNLKRKEHIWNRGKHICYIYGTYVFMIIYGIYMAHIWTIYEKYLWNIGNIYVRHTFSIYISYIIYNYIWNIYAINMEHMWNIYGAYMKYIWSIYEICILSACFSFTPKRGIELPQTHVLYFTVRTLCSASPAKMPCVSLR